ncbi:hypothetical protein [Gordonibacter urolithinfaciens]|uniref:hypothetical protein n=1 Tax=Gordonibacter urolithinfaciens TaxID=1335613 RepID=UPI001D06D495|nr:hypothetical protein [Gordonibacter urolithinfaciens]MCB7085816.1 hypothetical protein [Gordonibacter urolithinfaciens]
MGEKKPAEAGAYLRVLVFDANLAFKHDALAVDSFVEPVFHAKFLFVESYELQLGERDGIVITPKD